MIPVKEQLERNMEYIGKKYNAKKFIAYFQNFSNTYMPPERFSHYLDQACMPGIVEVYISTRPDCISDRHLAEASGFVGRTGIEATFELGLQTVNYHTLSRLNRGHTLAEFIDSVLRVRNAGFGVCAHLILDLPWDNMADAVENAKVLSALGVQQVKLHSLYIVKGTLLARLYNEKSIRLVSVEEYAKGYSLLEHLARHRGAKADWQNAGGDDTAQVGYKLVEGKRIHREQMEALDAEGKSLITWEKAVRNFVRTKTPEDFDNEKTAIANSGAGCYPRMYQEK